MEALKWAVTLLGSAIAIIIFIYVAVRAGSLAFFRSRMEHFRRVMHAAKEGEDRNADEG